MPVFLDAFFISKFELTQAQWERWAGYNPSSHNPKSTPSVWISKRQPVETLTWAASDAILRELGLTFPFEAQWEYAAHAGTDTPWCCAGIVELARYANLFDATRAGCVPVPGRTVVAGFGIDGFNGVAPVGSLEPNGFGLFDMHGNVAEWCADIGDLMHTQARYLGTGARSAPTGDDGGRVIRGGSYLSDPLEARCGARRFLGRNYLNAPLGLRPVRPVDR